MLYTVCNGVLGRNDRHEISRGYIEPAKGPGLSTQYSVLINSSRTSSPLRMSTMRAVLIKDGKGPIENLYVGEIERPVPKEGQVLVKVSAPAMRSSYVTHGALRSLRSA